MPDTTALYTTVRNTSGGEATFGFIPPHGKKLADDEDVTVFGDLWDRLHTGGRLNERLKDSLEAALLAGDVEIIKSPNVFLYDDTDDVVKQLSLDNGTLGTADPSWGGYSG